MAELNQQLSQADARYNARPSRPEDLSKIHELEMTILEADERIKHLIVRTVFSILLGFQVSMIRSNVVLLNQLFCFMLEHEYELFSGRKEIL